MTSVFCYSACNSIFFQQAKISGTPTPVLPLEPISPYTAELQVGSN